MHSNLFLPLQRSAAPHLFELLQKKTPEAVVDFSTPESIHLALTQHTDQISYFSQTKNYQVEREEEVHQLVQQGCVKSTEFFWNALQTALLD